MRRLIVRSKVVWLTQIFATLKLTLGYRNVGKPWCVRSKDYVDDAIAGVTECISCESYQLLIYSQSLALIFNFPFPISCLPFGQLPSNVKIL